MGFYFKNNIFCEKFTKNGNGNGNDEETVTVRERSKDDKLTAFNTKLRDRNGEVPKTKELMYAFQIYGILKDFLTCFWIIY